MRETKKSQKESQIKLKINIDDFLLIFELLSKLNQILINFIVPWFN